jgi:hypothetical protein
VLIDASDIALGVILTQPSEGNLDHPIYFYSIKLLQAEKNYTTIEREGLVMFYALYKFRHYFLGDHFELFTDHPAMKYLVNNLVLEGMICRCLFLF